MTRAMTLPFRCGEVRWVDGLPSQTNPEEKKRRRVLVIHPQELVACGYSRDMFVVGISTSPTEQQLSSGVAIELPDTSRYPSTTSGLTEPSWAIAEWVVCISPCYVEERAGHVRPYYAERAWELIRQFKVKPGQHKCSPKAFERCVACLLPAR